MFVSNAMQPKARSDGCKPLPTVCVGDAGGELDNCVRFGCLGELGGFRVLDWVRRFRLMGI